jgi:hypothetical protein
VTIIRAPRPDDHFTVIRNDVLRDARLSYRARGLLASILSRPDNWRCNSKALAAEATEGRDAVRVALTELQEVGYMERRKVKDPITGRFSWDEVVYDQPRKAAGQPRDWKSGAGEPDAGKPGTGNPTPESQASKEETITNDCKEPTYLARSTGQDDPQGPQVGDPMVGVREAKKALRVVRGVG